MRGRETDKRLPQTGFVRGQCKNRGLLGEWEINLELSLKYFLLLAPHRHLTSVLIADC